MPAVERQFLLFEAETTDPNVRFLVEHLEQVRGWLTAAHLCASTGWTDRQVRMLAEAASPEIISGQRGYRHINFATPDEIHHFVSWMESQAKKMITRAEAVRRRAHQLMG